MGLENDKGGAPTAVAWGCLAVAILIVCVVAGLAVIFAWDVNLRH